jgi:hypothetical protein
MSAVAIFAGFDGTLNSHSAVIGFDGRTMERCGERDDMLPLPSSLCAISAECAEQNFLYKLMHRGYTGTPTNQGDGAAHQSAGFYKVAVDAAARLDCQRYCLQWEFW